MVLDQCLASGPLDTVGARYDAAWSPEADAISWIGWQIRYQNPRMFPPRDRRGCLRRQHHQPGQEFQPLLRRRATRRPQAGPLWA